MVLNGALALEVLLFLISEWMVESGFLLIEVGSVAEAMTLFIVLRPHLISLVGRVKDPFAHSLARRIQTLPIQIGPFGSCIMNSCMKPVIQNNNNLVVCLHCFDNSCLECRCTYPLLE